MKQADQIVVTAFWDEEAKVWVAESEDVPGFATEAEIFEELAEKVRYLVPELLEVNGLADRARTDISIRAERTITEIA